MGMTFNAFIAEAEKANSMPQMFGVWLIGCNASKEWDDSDFKRFNNFSEVLKLGEKHKDKFTFEDVKKVAIKELTKSIFDEYFELEAAGAFDYNID